MTTFQSLTSILGAVFVAVLSAFAVASRLPLFRPAIGLAALIVMAYVAPEALLAAPIVFGTVFTEGQHAGEFLVSEAGGTRSRGTVTVTVSANTTLAAGMVLGKITATGKYVPYDEAGADGSQTAVAILWAGIENETAGALDYEAAIIVRDAEVSSADLQWKAGVDEAGGIVDLATVGIIAR